MAEYNFSVEKALIQLLDLSLIHISLQCCHVGADGSVRPSPPQRIAPLLIEGGQIAAGNQGGRSFFKLPQSCFA